MFRNKMFVFTRSNEQYEEISGKKEIAIHETIGKSKHMFFIRSLSQIKLDSFTIRFVPTKSTKEVEKRQIPSSEIEIEMANHFFDSHGNAENEGKNHFTEPEDPVSEDEPSKWHTIFDGSVTCGPKNPIGIEIEINAKKEQFGYFSFEGRLKNNSMYRYYGRLKFDFQNTNNN